MGKSYGLIEVLSTTAAIDALDIMCKTADVEFLTWEKKVGSCLVTVIVKGNVAAVTEAVEAACNLCVKKPLAHAVIANPHEEIVRIAQKSASRFQ